MSQTPPNNPSDAVNFDVIRESAFGDTSFEKELVQIFVSDTEERVPKLLEAVQNADVEAVKMEAHAIKGASGTIGADKLANLARQLEQMGVAGDLNPAALAFRKVAEEYQRVRAALDAYVAGLP